MIFLFSFKKMNNARGASLIEVLLSILILSIGILALISAMTNAIQLPKLSLYRAIATNLAHNHIDRIRANTPGFTAGQYDETLTYDGTFNVSALNNCVYPTCDSAKLVNMDKAWTRKVLREQLPAGGMRLDRLKPDGTNSTTEGNIWIIWQDPDSAAAFQKASDMDDCPDIVKQQYTNPVPRCLFIRFRL